MPLSYDLQDPDLDFAGRAEILSRNLKQAQADKLAEADAPRMLGNNVLNTGWMGGVASALQRGLGTYNTTQTEAEREVLNKEELRRYDDITRRMNEPATKTVLTKALKQGQGALAEPEIEETSQQVPLDMSNPNDLSADNARRMGLAAEMYKLPRAQKVAQEYLSKGANFPEALALLKTKQIEQAMQSQASRAQQLMVHRENLVSREEQGAANRAVTSAIGQGNLAVAEGRLQDQRDRAREKAEEAQRVKQNAVNASLGALAPIETSLAGLLLPPDKTGKRAIRPELEAYTGNIDQYMPDFALKQGTVDAGKKLNALKDQITMINLAAAKAAVGQSFGSMQVKEWDKFVNTLSSLDRAQGKEQLAESLQYIDNYVRNHKAELQAALVGGGAGAPTAPAAPRDAPKPGDIVDGMRFLGGDPGRQESWGAP